MSHNDIRFSRDEVVKEEAEGNYRLINQLFTRVEYKHADVVRLIHDPSDVRMAFGEFIPNPAEKDTVVVRPLFGVSMPHQMARDLIGYLQGQFRIIDAVKTQKDDLGEENAEQRP